MDTNPSIVTLSYPRLPVVELVVKATYILNNTSRYPYSVLVNENSRRLIHAVNVADNGVSVCFAKLAINFVEPASFEEPVKSVGRVRISLDLLGFGEEDLGNRLPGEFVRVRCVRCLK